MTVNRRLPIVAIVTPGTFTVPSDYSSSVERVVDETSKRLTEEAQVYVISKNSEGCVSRETIDGVTHLRPIASSAAGYRSAVLESLLRIAPDLVQVENRPLLVTRIKKAVRGAEVWLSLHSLTFVSSSRISAAALKRALTAADRIIVNSEFLRERIGRRYPRILYKISVNHLGTDGETFVSQWEPVGRERREAFKEQLGYKGKRIVLFAGRLLPIKGAHHLLRVWPKLIRKFPDAVLLIIGSAYYGSARITPYVRKLHRMGNSIPRHVRFLSYCPYSEMPRLFSIADVVVVPSGAKEAFGLVNVEAMAAGAPVVASRSGGIKEIVRHGVNGYLIRRSQIRQGLIKRINELLRDEEKRKRMGENGARIARSEFSWRNTADRQLALFHRYSHIFRGTGSERAGE